MSIDLAWAATELGNGVAAENFVARHHAKLCEAFGADRMTVFTVAMSQGKTVLASIFQRGLSQFSPIQLELESKHSIAGYVGSRRVLVNIADCYDEAELASFKPPVALLKAVDERTGYRTRQMLAAPILWPAGGATGGVVEVINRLDGKRFPQECEEALQVLCGLLGRALSEQNGAERRNPFVRDRTTQPTELLEIPALMARAEGAFREDATEDAARAREDLLQIYRNVFYHLPRLDPYETGEKPVRPVGGGDVRALEWLCRLAEAGHAGADRLLDRVLVLGEHWDYANTRSWIRWPTSLTPEAIHVKVLANRYPKVARALARQECEARDRDLAVILDWLDLGGSACRALADRIRELYPPPAIVDRREFSIVARAIGIVTQGRQKPEDPTAEDILAALVPSARKEPARVGS